MTATVTPLAERPDTTPVVGNTRRPRPRPLLIPATAFLVLVTQVPFFVTLYYSFRRWNLLRPDVPQRWVGLRNYVDQLTTDPSIYRTVWHTLLLTGSTVILGLVLGLGLAMLLNGSFPGRALARTLLITPMLVMPVVAGLIWKRLLLDSGSGLLPWLADRLANAQFAPLTDQPMLWIIVILVWQWAPFSMIILLSGLSSRDPSIVEAATVDGASGWALFWYITLPHLRSYLAVAFLLSTVLVLPTFGIVYVTTAGGPGYATTNLAFAVYQQAFTNYSVGAASALALINVILVIVALTGLVRVMGGHLVRGEEIK
jgi:sorbitol/mannitol transport system permease protein